MAPPPPPIAVTGCWVKMLERYIKTYMAKHTPLDKHHTALHATQYYCRTTVTNLIDYNYSRCLFLDFSSAFNTIIISYLIRKLHLLCTTSRCECNIVDGQSVSSAVEFKRHQRMNLCTGFSHKPLLFCIQMGLNVKPVTLPL